MSCELRAPGWLARHPWISILLIVLASLVFGILAYELRTNGPMIFWDLNLAETLHTTVLNIPSWLNEYMTFGFFLGKQDLLLLGAVLTVYFLYKRFWAELAMVFIGWGGGSFIWTPMIYYFNRMRPEKQVGIEVRIPSFPSGHTMFAVLALGLLAYLLVPNMPSRFWKWVVALALVFLILFVGFSRVMQGGHYLSDVIAGYALGIGWGTLVYTLLEFIGRRGAR